MPQGIKLWYNTIDYMIIIAKKLIMSTELGRKAMKRAEYLLLLLPLLFLAFCGGYFLGTAQQSGGVTITAAPTVATEPRTSVVLSTTEAEEAASAAAPTETDAPWPLNINTATAEELTALPGIGETIAQNIVDFRRANGLFASVDALDEVPGIGEKRLAQIRDDITVEDTDENTGS